MDKSARRIWCNTICNGPIAVLPIASHLSYCILRLTESSSLCNNAQLRHLSENFTMSGKRTTILIVLRCGLIGFRRSIPDSNSSMGLATVAASSMLMKCLSR